MFDIGIRVVFVLLAVVGIVCLLHRFLIWLLKTDNPGKLLLIMTLKGHDEKAEFTLRSAIERMRWLGNGEVRLICVDCGMDRETRTVCELLSLDLPSISLCYPEELCEIICG